MTNNEFLFNELNLPVLSRRLIEELLDFTPVARRGQTTMIPRAAALAITANDDTKLSETINELMKPRTLIRENGFVSFSILDEASWIESGHFLHYKFNSSFLTAINNTNAS